MTAKPGLALAGIFFCLYGALALTVDLPKATYGFKSDEATYYMMGLSLAYDGDLAYERSDLVRVWREFPSGPAGVFLKRGRTLKGAPDPNPSRYFYGKAFIYPLFAAPLIRLFGSNGFLLLNALALTLVLFCAYLFLHARSGPWPSAFLAGAFVLASVVPVYSVQMMPETFNFSLACVAYFCWLYKEVADPERSPRRTAWLFTPRSDLVAAVLLGIATFSKPTNALLFAAPLIWWIFRLKAEATGAEGTGAQAMGAADTNTVASAFRRKIADWRRKLLMPTLAFALVAGGLFAVNMAISGDWNYQGGGERRKSYYFEFPLQTDGTTNQLGVTKSRETAMTQVILNPRTFGSNLLHNLEYFVAGRYAGLTGYFFPGLFATLVLLSAPRRRPGWQWLVLAAALAQGLIFIIGTPYTWSGGGVGNRYFMSGYGVMLFLLPPVESLWLALAPWAIGGLFMAPLVLNPFTASFRPDENAKSGPLRLFPVELTLLNDLPFTAERGRVWFGDVGPQLPGFLVSFLDDNAYQREEDRSFWTRGDSRAELVLKANAGMRRAIFQLAAGPVPAVVTIAIGGRQQRVELAPAQTGRVVFPLPSGLRYEKEVENVQLWTLTITTRGGFTPIFYEANAADARYLGVRVKPMLESRAP